MNTDEITTETALTGLELLGKTAAALTIIVVMILLCAWLFKRFNLRRRLPNHLRLVSSIAVGAKERVVIVELHDTWLVLGVGGANVSKLHELPAPLMKSAADGGRQ